MTKNDQIWQVVAKRVSKGSATPTSQGDTKFRRCRSNRSGRGRESQTFWGRWGPAVRNRAWQTPIETYGGLPRSVPNGGAPASPKCLGLPTSAGTVWPWATKFDMITHVGRSVFLGGQPRSTLMERGSTSQRIFGTPIYAQNVWPRVTKFGRSRSVFVRGQPRPHPKGRGSSPSNFRDPRSCVLTVWPTTTKFGTITHVERSVFPGGQGPRSHPKGWGPCVSQNLWDLHARAQYEKQQRNFAWCSN